MGMWVEVRMWPPMWSESRTSIMESLEEVDGEVRRVCRSVAVM